jgi:aerobic carbon-monoxide dehydrogenase medium subunit
MYAETFVYHRAGSLAEAHRLLAEHPGAKLLAGGHSLIPLLKLRLAAPPALIDIGRVPELRGIELSGGTLRVGALSTHAELADSPAVRDASPALAEAAGLVGDPAVRNRGTIGGNIAHADPASDLPAVLVALDAHVVATGPSGERTLPAADFFTGLMMTALSEDEVITAVLVPASPGWRGSAYVKFAHPASRYAVIGVAAAVRMQGGTCQDVRVALGGLVPHARRTAAVEQSLAGTSADEAAITAAAGLVTQDLGEDVLGDIYASAEYRAAVAPVYVARAVAAAVARAGTV